VTTPTTTLTEPADPQVIQGRKGSARLVYPTAQEMRSVRKRARHGRSVADRLTRLYAVETNGCWRWLGCLTTSGYGHFSIGGVYYQAHLLVYILNVGPLPTGLEPDHLCRNRWCVNPRDIEFVTHAVNSQRGYRTVLTPEQVTAIRRAGRTAGVRALAREYGVNHATISRIVNGLTWPEPVAVEAVA